MEKDGGAGFLHTGSSEDGAGLGSDPAASASETFRAQQWRLALAESCSDLLAISVDELRQAYAEYLQHGSLKTAVQGRPGDTLPAKTRFLEDLSLAPPRDFVDYVIMRTLRQKDAFALQNSRSWTFNLMDPCGDGRAYEAEFIRYAPLMSPVTDSAIAGLMFRALSCVDSMSEKGIAPHQRNMRDNTEPDSSVENAKIMDLPATGENAMNPSESFIDFERWDAFLVALGRIFSKSKPEWIEAKKLLRLDPREPLVKAQAAIDHSGTLPVPGKLFLSERYLCFAASIGWAHFVLPLGVIKSVRSTELALLRRDALVIEFALPKCSEKGARDPDAKFMPDKNSREGLILSFNEFRSTHIRDAWHAYVQEMVAAHIVSHQYRVVHVDANFVMDADGVTSSSQSVAAFRDGGDAVGSTHSSQKPLGTSLLTGNAKGASDSTSAQGRKSSVPKPPSSLEALIHAAPPAFARIARLNILRSRALKRILHGRLPKDLFVFSADLEVAAGHDLNDTESAATLFEQKRRALRRYIDTAQRVAAGERSWWFARALQRVKMNIEANRRRQGGGDHEPLDLVSLGNQISTFIELVTPIGCMFDAVCYVIRWNRPALSGAVLALLLCAAAMDAVSYLIPLIILGYCVLLISVRSDLQRQTSGMQTEPSSSRAAYLSGVFARVHHGLVATQVWLLHMNRHLEKFESIHLWRKPALTRQYIYGLVFYAVLLAVLPFRWLFAAATIYVFTLQFRDPERQDFIDRWYASVPGRPA
jgi:hypothetical protein